MVADDKSAAAAAAAAQQYKREPAIRVFAHEISMTSLSATKDEETKDRFTPTFAYSPTGAKINRVFIVGTLTEVDEIGAEDSNFVKGRLVDATGAVNIMAGQYQAEVAGVMRELAGKLPAFVAIVGKPNIYKPKDGGSYTSIRPEEIHVVDEKIVEMFTAETARRTIERLVLLKQVIKTGTCLNLVDKDKVPDLKTVIAAYNPNVDDLKYMVKVAIGKAAPKAQNGDGGVAKPSAPAAAPGSTAGAPAAGDKVNSSDPNVDAAFKLLRDMCALSEDGTVGGGVLVDRLVQRKLASPDTALTLIKNVMDQGMAYEPRMGRLKAVA
jgi:RPA family protein